MLLLLLLGRLRLAAVLLPGCESANVVVDALDIVPSVLIHTAEFGPGLLLYLDRWGHRSIGVAYCHFKFVTNLKRWGVWLDFW